LVDFDGGFNAFMAAAFKLNGTVEETYGAPFDPFKNDVNFVLSVLALEELGATGNKGLALLLVNPVHANAVAGLATSATAQATVERFLLWQLRHEIVEPFNETAQQVFARVSALRDSLDGPQFDDQGIVNTDPRFIAVPDSFINLMPTDVHGLTFARTPQQNINILTLGAADGKGVFFPNGLIGKIHLPTGYNITKPGLDDFPSVTGSKTAPQQSVASLGNLTGPITADGPATVPGYLQLTQTINGSETTRGAFYRGYQYTPRAGEVNDDAPNVDVGTQSGTYGQTPPFPEANVTDSAATATGSPGRKLLRN
jgi:hypothetical protein